MPPTWPADKWSLLEQIRGQEAAKAAEKILTWAEERERLGLLKIYYTPDVARVTRLAHGDQLRLAVMTISSCSSVQPSASQQAVEVGPKRQHPQFTAARASLSTSGSQ